MLDALTKSAARNIFYGGSVFFFLILVILTGQSYSHIVNVSTDAKGLTDSVTRGKRIWEKHACVDCHTILGEGAYFAPELGNVWLRYGGKEDPTTARAGLKEWMKNQPSKVEGRRQMPQFNLNEEELEDLVNFFEWVSRIDTQGWPPNKAG